MISLATARKLREADLQWSPALHDFFAVPDRGMDERVFVISEVMAYVELRNNLPMVTFQGTTEWALDYLLKTEVVWMPREEQLRTLLMHYLVSEEQPALILSGTPEEYICSITFLGNKRQFEAGEASEAYAAALLHVLSS